jgi:cytochrome c2
MAGFALPMDRKTQYGLRLLDRMSCRRCHVWNGRGNRLATDLDQVYFTSSVENLKSALHDPVDHMPDFALDDGQVEAAITGLLGVSRMVSPAKEVPPVIVYFDNKVGQRHHPFELRCGGCHRALTVRFGALGKGSVGPNLSGLLSEYYPKDGSGAFWTAERLGRWLANPRQLRANALMQPVFLTNDEVGKILDGFNPEAEYMRVEVSP